MSWKPGLTSRPLEELMESHDLPESDRDELRRFAEVLRRRKEKAAGKTLSPAPDGMRDWLLGKEANP